MPTRRYSLGSTVALWKKTTPAGKHWYVVGGRTRPSLLATELASTARPGRRPLETAQR
jgi:hypothetical protein